MPPDTGCKFVFFFKVIVLKFEIRKKKTSQVNIFSQISKLTDGLPLRRLHVVCCLFFFPSGIGPNPKYLKST